MYNLFDDVFSLELQLFVIIYFKHCLIPSDILESYARSPFLATETDNFMDIRHREHQGANRFYIPNLTVRLLERFTDFIHLLLHT